jgi:hypothetical protein
MNASDFRRIALNLEGAEESSHMGSPDFRVGGRIFATLASEEQGFGNLMEIKGPRAATAERCAMKPVSAQACLIQADV